MTAVKSSTSKTEIPLWVFVVLGVILIIVGATFLKDTDLPVFQGIEIHLGKIVANIGVVLVFIQVINVFFYKPLSDAIQNRTKELESAFTNAEQLRTEMEQMRVDYEDQLATTESKAREQIQAQLTEAKDLRQKLLDEANQKAEDLLKKTKEQVAYEKQKVVQELRHDVVELTFKAAEALIDKNLDSEVNRRLVKDFVDQFEVEKS